MKKPKQDYCPLEPLTVERLDAMRRAIVAWHDTIASGVCPRCQRPIARKQRRHTGTVHALPCWHLLYRTTRRKEA